MSWEERTEKPTERRRREAKQRGDVAISRNLVLSASLVGLVIGISLWGSQLTNDLMNLMKVSLSSVSATPLHSASLIDFLSSVITQVGRKLTPILIVTLSAAVMATLLQTGFLWIPSSIAPNLDRINGSKLLARWASPRTLTDGAVTLIKLISLVTVTATFVWQNIRLFGVLFEFEPQINVALLWQLFWQYGVTIATTILILSVFDYAYEYWLQEKSLMMTVEELRREQREEALDPRFKQARNESASEPVRSL
ncbi:MAG: EscU/YscU/HrcU family type III secretion system export apparatus switch protein [Planctomycetes bacterium]|nr:EscU/YscU/HrcU family type III secretion system export apparatus switch protein [Planctomycetota bacterium]